MENLILYGAGHNASTCIEKYKTRYNIFLVDSNKSKSGKMINGFYIYTKTNVKSY